MEVNLPAQISDQLRHFRDFYQSKHKKREISVCYSLGDALVIYTLPGRPRPHELKVATLGMLILIQFNEENA